MTAYDSLPDAVTEIFGEEATAEQAYDLLTVDVPPSAWLTALETARDALGCTYFDWLSAVDEPGTGFRVCAHVVALGEGAPKRLLLRTTVPHEAPVLTTAIGVYAGAGWHERETHEMFGVAFEGHPHLVPLLLPENFEGHPLRKDFVLAARVAKAWPGAKEPGESHDGGGPKRRQMLPPGVPDPNEWGPLKGQLPPAPARPARAAAGDRPVRRTRTATEGSASQAAAEPAAPVRRSRSASEGSASQGAVESGAPDAPAARPPRRSRSAADGSASQTTPEPGTSPEADTAPEASARPPRRSRSAADGSASQAAPEAGGQSAPDTTGPAPRAAAATPRTRSSDAPWHHARPAFDDETPPPATPSATEPPAPTAPQAPGPETPASEATPAAEPEPQAPAATPAPEPEAPAPEGTPAPGPDAPEPDAPEPDAPAGPQAPGSKNVRAAGSGEGADAEPPAGRGGTDTPTDTAGGDPA
ncbi:NADH-quinone oxidoreductase subunit C [Streptomyces litmocidini]|uniref:NADH-quinone oxidoreductase subunit C n=1 Tax=Streptomyces litmocidini TaxID=67318 RepID=UPI0033ECEF4F